MTTIFKNEILHTKRHCIVWWIPFRNKKQELDLEFILFPTLTWTLGPTDKQQYLNIYFFIFWNNSLKAIRPYTDNGDRETACSSPEVEFSDKCRGQANGGCFKFASVIPGPVPQFASQRVATLSHRIPGDCAQPSYQIQ